MGRRQRALDPQRCRARLHSSAGQYASPDDVAQRIAVFAAAVDAKGPRYDPMQVGVTRAFMVTDSIPERDAALDRRLQTRLRQLKLATTPDSTVHGGPTAPLAIRRRSTSTSAIYGKSGRDRSQA